MQTLPQQFRKEPTPTEHILWQYLRDRRLGGLKFRRQVPMGKYIVDFYCHAKRLVVEVDGGVHYEPGQPERDAVRQARLEEMGYRVLRFTTEEVTGSVGTVLQVIQSVCA